MKRRVVITGLGVVTPVGNQIGTLNCALMSGTSGIQHLPELEKLGVKVTYPDRKPFMEASKQVYEAYADKIPGGMDTINKIINFKN